MGSSTVWQTTTREQIRLTRMTDGDNRDDGTDRDAPGGPGDRAPSERPAPYPPPGYDPNLGYPPPEYYAGPPSYESGPSYPGYPPPEPYGAPQYPDRPGYGVAPGYPGYGHEGYSGQPGYPAPPGYPGYPGHAGYPPGYPGDPNLTGYPAAGYAQPPAAPVRRRRVWLWSTLGAVALVAIAVVVLFGSPGVLVTTKLSHAAVESYIEQHLGAAGVVCNGGHDITIARGASVECSAQDGARYRVTITRTAGAHYTVVRESP